MQLGQINLDHLVGAAHHAQPLVIAARADRNLPAHEDRDERDQPNDREDQYFRADGCIENSAEAESSNDR